MESAGRGTHRALAGSLRMRRAILLLSLLPLAACSEKKDSQPGMIANIIDQAVPDVRNVPAEGNAIRPAEPQPDLRSAEAPRDMPAAAAIPVSLQGRWTGITDRCGDKSADLDLTVSGDSLIFHESVGTVKGVTSGPGGRVRVDADFTGEGQSWSSHLDLRPSANGRELTITNDGTAVTRKRCG